MLIYLCMHALYVRTVYMCVYEQEVEAAVEADVAGGGQQQAAGQVSCVRVYFEQTDAFLIVCLHSVEAVFNILHRERSNDLEKRERTAAIGLLL
jgi:hypothetical protein